MCLKNKILKYSRLHQAPKEYTEKKKKKNLCLNVIIYYMLSIVLALHTNVLFTSHRPTMEKVVLLSPSDK